MYCSRITPTNLTDWQQTKVALISSSLWPTVQCASLHHADTLHCSPVVQLSHWILLNYQLVAQLWYVVGSAQVGHERHPMVRVWQQSHENGDTNHRLLHCYTVTRQSQTSAHANHSPTWHSLTESQQVGASSGHRVIWDGGRPLPVMTTISWQNREQTTFNCVLLDFHFNSLTHPTQCYIILGSWIHLK